MMEAGDERRAALADEGQRDSGVRYGVGHNGDIQDNLKGDMGHNADDQVGPEHILGMVRDDHKAPQKKDKHQNHADGAEESQLLTDDGKNHIVLASGTNPSFCTLSPSLSEEPPGARWRRAPEESDTPCRCSRGPAMPVYGPDGRWPY